MGTELEDIPIRACLQMASGINFDEDKDMSGLVRLMKHIGD